MDKGMISKTYFILFYFMGLISFSGVVMAEGGASISIGSVDAVYDIRINGMPVVKNKSIQSRSLLVPVDIYLKEGKNEVQVNFLGAYQKDDKIIRELSEKALIQLGVRLAGKRYGLIEIKRKDQAAFVNLKSNDGGEVQVEDEFESEKSIFYAGSIPEKSTLVSFVIFIESFETKDVYWLDGEKIDEADFDKLKDAYMDAYNYIDSGKGIEYMKKLTPYYKSIADFYYDWTFEETIKDLSKHFEKIDQNGAVLEKPDFSNVKMEILAGGLLSRFIYSPLAWDKDGKTGRLNIAFKKVNGKFEPVFISNDYSF
jgi:hypothetical protein